MIDKELAKSTAREACVALFQSMKGCPIKEVIEVMFVCVDTIIDEANKLVDVENERRNALNRDFGDDLDLIHSRKYPSAVIGAKVRGIVVDGEFHPADDHGTVTITI